LARYSKEIPQAVQKKTTAAYFIFGYILPSSDSTSGSNPVDKAVHISTTPDVIFGIRFIFSFTKNLQCDAIAFHNS
jgi:hypothetical protein